MLQLTLPDMTCNHCVQRVTNAVLSVDPQAQVVADPPSRQVEISTKADEQTLRDALSEAGYPAT
ncbi:heavy-metal-associated domain-containing protein [Aquamicrobium segne]|uniref:Heavy-metal-associated domain-containing protein n=1 Tax=Aquamicrobium segne TaxID=469547 RepID=A0ABW0H158_9HYPH